ncbi:DUF6615 family protein [Rhizobium mongolense]|uniref:DUF6615 family protein n=1 Tax=Rhizobium mongolense TaxID=57676 RepID=UPI00355783B8
MLCQFSQSFPSFVEDFLEYSRTMGRSFREESVTDILMSGLFTASSPYIHVQFPNETVTGADMEWNFADVGTGRFFRIMLQAKRAESKNKQWQYHKYQQLDHQAAGALVETLRDFSRQAAVPTFPIYIFYNPLATTALTRAAGKRNVLGVNIADAYQIERVVKHGLKSGNRFKNLATLSPYMRPMTDLFCPTVQMRTTSSGKTTISFQTAASDFTEAPTPDAIHERLTGMFFARAGSEGEIPAVPNVGTDIPDDVRIMIEPTLGARYASISRRPERHNYWRVVFVSDSTRAP